MASATALERTRMVVRGVRSELAVEDGRITITKESPTDAGPRTVSFGVDRVRGAAIEAPPRGGRGWLHVSAAGGSPIPPSELAAAGDPYTLPIASRSLRAARKLARLVERHVHERGMPMEAGPNQGRFSSGVSLPAAEDRPTRRRADPNGADARDDATSGTETAPGDDAAEEHRPTEPTGAGSSDHTTVEERERVAERLVTHLRELADLRDAGVLREEEFERAKARLLR